MNGQTCDSQIAVLQQCLHTKRIRYRPHLNPLTHHREITPDMRAKVVDWLRELCRVFHWDNLTYYTSVHTLDLYLCKELNPIPKDKLQQIGASVWV